MFDTSYMQLALQQAEEAALRNEIPVGAIIVDTKTKLVIASQGNRVEALNDPTAHAEILAIQQASKRLTSMRLVDCDLYVTLEPCVMCAAALTLAKIRRIYFGAASPKTGAIQNGMCIFESATLNHRPEIYDGIMEAECSMLLKNFFTKLRNS
jgi:tRNA(Arg) A34 adenosine deaminase TadA